MTTQDVLPRAERVAKVAAAQAERVDRDGAFPQATVDALRREGLLGLVSAAAVGGEGLGLPAAATVVERLARACGSSAMVTCMHYCGVMVLEAHAPEATRREVAAGRHLSTLAFSEAGSRSHFWAPLGTAKADGAPSAATIRLDAKKSWITSARHATAYVWSSAPSSAAGPSTLWLVPRDTAGLSVGAPFDGLGLRGNDSTPVTAAGSLVPASARLGPDGGGFDIMMGVVLPWFSVLNAACSIGLCESAVLAAGEHVGRVRHEHLNQALRDLPTIRAYLARMRIQTDLARALLDDTVAALGANRPDAMLKVLEVKAAAGEAALLVTDLALRVCGGAAFRREVGIDRAFRDARAASVMAPTTDQLYDFIGKAVAGMPLFG